MNNIRAQSLPGSVPGLPKEEGGEMKIVENTTTILKSKLVKFRMVLNNIEGHRNRVDYILLRLSDIENEEEFVSIAQSLDREGLIVSQETLKKFGKGCCPRIEKYRGHYQRRQYPM